MEGNIQEDLEFFKDMFGYVKKDELQKAEDETVDDPKPRKNNDHNQNKKKPFKDGKNKPRQFDHDSRPKGNFQKDRKNPKNSK